MNESAAMRVGIIGVGLMGHGIAKNVVTRGGFPLAFLDHPGNQPVDDLLRLGATACKTPGEIAGASDVIILCVTGSPQVEAILTGEAGVLSRLRKGTIISIARRRCRNRPCGWPQRSGQQADAFSMRP